MKGGVLIVDFGTQFCQLIARRVREMGVYSRITVPERAAFSFDTMQPGAVILSGGPRSVYEQDAPALPEEMLQRGVPVLGICYGLQWMAKALGGDVQPAAASGGEYGRTEIDVTTAGTLLAGVDAHTTVWMSHGDRIEVLPDGFETLAKSEPCPIAAAADPQRGYYGLQFHPEVAHTQQGTQILRNFVLDIAGCPAEWQPGSIVDDKIAAIRQQVGEDGEIVLGLSGGVDSSVAAVLMHRAIGSRLHCVFVDNGLLRQDEREGVERLFGETYRMDLKVVDASARFLEELAGVEDPEQKRKIIGRVFVEVFREEAKALRNARFLGQGTLSDDPVDPAKIGNRPGADAVIAQIQDQRQPRRGLCHGADIVADTARGDERVWRLVDHQRIGPGGGRGFGQTAGIRQGACARALGFSDDRNGIETAPRPAIPVTAVATVRK